MSRKYLSCAETAKLIRQALKEAFPAIKFSVRSSLYSGGASINIGWTDGPTSDQVKSIADRFEGAYFDGMIDYKGSRYAMIDGEQVHFGADFIFENREYSDAAIESAIRRVFTHYAGNLRDVERPTVADFRSGKLWDVMIPGLSGYNVDSLQSRIHEALGKHTYCLTAKSTTAARAFVTHDDGYGRSCGSGSSVGL